MTSKGVYSYYFYLPNNKVYLEALTELGFHVIICAFHYMKTFGNELNARCEGNQDEWVDMIKKFERCKSYQVLEQLLEEVKTSFNENDPFGQYFEDNWLCEDWLLKWIDLGN